MTHTGAMSDTETTPPPVAAEEQPGSSHGHESQAHPLGPVDLTAWAYALAGAAVGLIVVLALYVASGA